MLPGLVGNHLDTDHSLRTELEFAEESETIGISLQTLAGTRGRLIPLRKTGPRAPTENLKHGMSRGMVVMEVVYAVLPHAYMFRPRLFDMISPRYIPRLAARRIPRAQLRGYRCTGRTHVRVMERDGKIPVLMVARTNTSLLHREDNKTSPLGSSCDR